MIEYFTNLSPIVINQWGYVILFVTSFLESVPFIGLLNPGATIANAAGFFAQQEFLSLPLVMLVCFGGLFTGDLTAYFLGRRFGYPLLLNICRRFRIDLGRVERARALVYEHVGKALTLGRFIFPVRVFASFSAGAARCSLPRFLFFSFLGTLFWAVTLILIGFFFGLGFEALSPFIGQVFLGSIVIGLFLIWGFRSFNRAYQIFHRSQIYIFGALVASVFLLGKLIEDILFKSFFINADAYVYDLLRDAHSAALDTFFSVASFLFSSPSVLVLTAAVSVSLFVWRRYYDTLLFLSATAAAFILTDLLKRLFMLPRPPEAAVDAASYAFPSGHSSAATVFFLVTLAVIWSSTWTLPKKAVAWSAAVLGILLVAFSRLYLGAHWFSDVLGGIALGVLCVTGTMLLFELGLAAYENFRARREIF